MHTLGKHKPRYDAIVIYIMSMISGFWKPFFLEQINRVTQDGLKLRIVVEWGRESPGANGL